MAVISVLSVGLIPSLIDYRSPDYAAFPGLDEEKVMEALQNDIALLNSLGYEAELGLVDFGETAEAVLLQLLQNKKYDCVIVGAGVRLVAANTPLFEKIINAIHEQAPNAKLCFNTAPTDTAEAVQRWFPTSSVAVEAV